jgi:hypothetical protein
MKLILDTPTHKIEIPDGATVRQLTIRRITTKAFFRRLKFGERKVLRNSTLDAVVDLREDLQRSLYIDLDDVLSRLLDTGLLDQSRIDELLVDGTAAEETEL